MPPSPMALAHAVAAMILRQESNALAAIRSFTSSQAEAEEVAAELRVLSQEHAISAELLRTGEAGGLVQALDAAAECIGAGEAIHAPGDDAEPPPGGRVHV